MVRKYIKNNKGFTAIYVILFLAIFMPFMFFLTVDLPHFMSMNRKIKSTLDNATSTAVTRINEAKASSGVLEISEQEAKDIAMKVIIETFNLNDDLSLTDKSLIDNKPDIEIVVVNNISSTPTYTSPNGTFYILNPSVIIYGEVPVKARFFKVIEKNIKYTSIAEVQFRK